MFRRNESRRSTPEFDVYDFILANLKEALRPTDHTVFFRTYSQCWTAREAVTVLAQQNNMSREEAIEVGKKLLEQGAFDRVTGSAAFDDSSDLFRFAGVTPNLDETRERSQSFDSVFSGVLEKFFSKSPKQLRNDLRKACETDNTTVACQILRQRTLNVDDPLDGKGWTALHYAAREGAANIVTILNREFRADANVDSAFVYDVGDSWTPLMMAAYSGKLGVVTALCENCRVDPFITDELGRTALEISRLYGRTLCARYLSQLEELSVTLVDPEMSPQSPEGTSYEFNVFNDPSTRSMIPVGYSSLSTGIASLMIDESKEIELSSDREGSFFSPRRDPRDQRIAELETMLAARDKEILELKKFLTDEVREKRNLEKALEHLRRKLSVVQNSAFPVKKRSAKRRVSEKHHLGVNPMEDDLDSE